MKKLLLLLFFVTLGLGAGTYYDAILDAERSDYGTGGGGGGGTPGGSSGDFQYNNAGTFGGVSGFTYNSTTDTITIDSSLILDINGDLNVDGNTTIDGTLELSIGTSINEFSVDGTFAGDSDDAIPTEKAIKTYVDALPSPAFSTTSNVTSNSAGDLTTDDFVFGSSQLDDDGDTDHDSKFFFDKSKGAFRAGEATINVWDETNIGNNSTATGYNTRASGIGSVAMGSNTRASGNFSFAAGNITKATALNSTAFGKGSDAGGDACVAMGDGTKANGDYSFATGDGS